MKGSAPPLAAVPAARHITRWHFRMAVFSYLYAASAGASVLALAGYKPLVPVPFLWLLFCLSFCWRGGSYHIPPSAKRWIEAGALLAGLVFIGTSALRIGNVTGPPGDLLNAAALFLLVLQGLRAPLIRNSAEAEGSIFTSLILFLYCSCQLPLGSGAVLMAIAGAGALSALSMAQMVGAMEQGAASGTVVHGSLRLARTVRTGTWLALMSAALGTGMLFSVQRVFPDVGKPLGIRLPNLPSAQSPSGQVPGPQQDKTDYSLSLSFREQSTSAPSDTVLYRVAAPRYVARFRTQAFCALGPDAWNLSTDVPMRNLGKGSVAIEDLLGMGSSPGLPGIPYEIRVRVLERPSNALLVVDRPVGIEIDRDVSVDQEDSFFVMQLEEGATYSMRGRSIAWDRVDLSSLAVPADPAYARYGEPIYVQQPVRDLALVWGGTETMPWPKAARIADALRNHCSWQSALQFRRLDNGSYDIVDAFLLETRSGNCLNFSTALAVLLRASHIPCRIAVGYLGHIYDARNGEWLLRESDFHGWCEVPLQGAGWVPLDPVPAAMVAGYPAGGPGRSDPSVLPARMDTNRPGEGMRFRVNAAAFKRNLLDFLSMTWPWMLLVSVLGWAAAIFHQPLLERLREMTHPYLSSMDEIGGAYYAVCLAARRRGFPKKDSQTTMEYGRRVTSLLPAVSPGMMRLAEIQTFAQFAREAPAPSLRAEARTLGKSLVKAFSRS